MQSKYLSHFTASVLDFFAFSLGFDCDFVLWKKKLIKLTFAHKRTDTFQTNREPEKVAKNKLTTGFEHSKMGERQKNDTI